MGYEVKDGKGIIPDDIDVISDRLLSCTRLEPIELSEGITVIAGEAFSGCTSLQSIVIPGSVTTIGREAFSGCTSLQSIAIPDSVTEIGESAFYNCTSLQSITIATKEKDPDSFRKRTEYLLIILPIVAKDISLRVPIGCGYAYRHYPAFEGKFKTIIADIDV